VHVPKPAYQQHARDADGGSEEDDDAALRGRYASRSANRLEPVAPSRTTVASPAKHHHSFNKLSAAAVLKAVREIEDAYGTAQSTLVSGPIAATAASKNGAPGSQDAGSVAGRADADFYVASLRAEFRPVGAESVRLAAPEVPAGLVESVVAVERRLSLVLEAAERGCELWRSASSPLERQHSFSQWARRAAQYRGAVVAAIARVRRWQKLPGRPQWDVDQRGEEIANEAQAAVARASERDAVCSPFFWRGRLLAPWLITSLDGLAALPELREWLGAEFPMRRNPLCLPTSLDTRPVPLRATVMRVRVAGSDELRMDERLVSLRAAAEKQRRQWWARFRPAPAAATASEVMEEAAEEAVAAQTRRGALPTAVLLAEGRHGSLGAAARSRQIVASRELRRATAVTHSFGVARSNASAAAAAIAEAASASRKPWETGAALAANRVSLSPVRDALIAQGRVTPPRPASPSNRTAPAAGQSPLPVPGTSAQQPPPLSLALSQHDRPLLTELGGPEPVSQAGTDRGLRAATGYRAAAAVAGSVRAPHEGREDQPGTAPHHGSLQGEKPTPANPIHLPAAANDAPPPAAAAAAAAASGLGRLRAVVRGGALKAAAAVKSALSELQQSEVSKRAEVAWASRAAAAGFDGTLGDGAGGAVSETDWDEPLPALTPRVVSATGAASAGVGAGAAMDRARGLPRWWPCAGMTRAEIAQARVTEGCLLDAEMLQL
jgi:hypothetical protein